MGFLMACRYAFHLSQASTSRSFISYPLMTDGDSARFREGITPNPKSCGFMTDGAIRCWQLLTGFPVVVRASQQYAARLEAHRPGLDLSHICAWFPRPDRPSVWGCLTGLEQSVRLPSRLNSIPSVRLPTSRVKPPLPPLGGLSFIGPYNAITAASSPSP